MRAILLHQTKPQHNQNLLKSRNIQIKINMNVKHKQNQYIIPILPIEPNFSRNRK